VTLPRPSLLAPIALIAALGALAVGWHAAPSGVSRASSREAVVADPEAHARERRAAEVKARFDQAVLMLHAREHDHAVAALHRVLELAPAMPEAHVNMGYALLGLGQARAARDFFNGAIELRATQANAYYGLALALEADRDLRGALGAMRTYLHLSRADDPHRAKARAALWEWESALSGGRSDDTGRPK
jgi:tetratricopeptide (TPR) repeat protein